MALVDIPSHTSMTHPLQVMFVNTDTASSASYPKLVVRLGDNSHLHLKQSVLTYEQSSSVTGPNLVVGSSRVMVGRDSTLFHTFLQEVSEQTRHLEVMSGSIGGNSR